MDEREIRLEAEHGLIASVFPGIERSGDWFLIGHDGRATKAGWSPDPFPVAFHAQPGHPGQVPYGIYVPSSALVGREGTGQLQFHGKQPPTF